MRSRLTRRLHVLIATLVLALSIGALTAFRADALPPVIDLAVTPADITVQGASSKDLAGFSTATGDLNGDTVDDLIFGAWVAGNHAGKTYVIYGGAGLPSVIDLSATSADVTVHGKASSYSAYSVASGDINGDTVDDLIVGAFRAALDQGEVYVIYGGPALPSSIDLSLAPAADVTVRGGGSISDSIGQDVSAGDVNGDTVDDVIVGDRNADPASSPNAGAAYVVYGGPAVPSLIDFASSSPDVTVLGEEFSDELGETVAAGDLNGDTVDDLLIGAKNVDGPTLVNVGAAYVIFGGVLPATVDLSATTADVTVYGVHTGDEFATALDTGDVNGDTTPDLVIGAPHAINNDGEVYVIYGGAGLPATLDLASTAPDVRVTGADNWDLVGSDVATGDISGDGIDDVALGAEWEDPPGAAQGGQSHVVFGGAALSSSVELATTNGDLAVLGAASGDKSGSALAMGDLDGDTLDDLIIGAHLADPQGRNEAGEVYVILAEPPPPPPAVGGVSYDTTPAAQTKAERGLLVPVLLGTAGGGAAIMAAACVARRRLAAR